MRNKFSNGVEECRVYGKTGSHNGVFRLPCGERTLQVIVSDGMGWEHVSVSLPDRCPTWDEMDYVKRSFWRADEIVMQLHVASRDHVNIHPFCLHLWRPLTKDIPTPPIICV